MGFVFKTKAKLLNSLVILEHDVYYLIEVMLKERKDRYVSVLFTLLIRTAKKAAKQSHAPSPLPPVIESSSTHANAPPAEVSQVVRVWWRKRCLSCRAPNPDRPTRCRRLRPNLGPAAGRFRRRKGWTIHYRPSRLGHARRRLYHVGRCAPGRIGFESPSS